MGDQKNQAWTPDDTSNKAGVQELALQVVGAMGNGARYHPGNRSIQRTPGLVCAIGTTQQFDLSHLVSPLASADCALAIWNRYTVVDAILEALSQYILECNDRMRYRTRGADAA